MLHRPWLLLWFRFFVSFSISVSLTELIKNELKTLFIRHLPIWFFALCILDTRFKPNIYKKPK